MFGLEWFEYMRIFFLLWLKARRYMLPVGLPLLFVGFFMPWGDSLERPSWFNKVMLNTTGHHIFGPYILPEQRDLCDEYRPLIIDEAVAVKGYAHSAVEFERTMEEFALFPDQASDLRVGCFPCIQELVVDGYDFIEAYYVSAKDLRRIEAASKFQKIPRLRGYDLYVTETGWFRYRLVDRSSDPERCEVFDVTLRRKGRDASGIPKSRGKIGIPSLQLKKMDVERQCISVERVPAPSSRYLVENIRVIHQEINGLVGEGLILRNSSIVTDRLDGNVVASEHRFSYWRKFESGPEANRSNSRYAYVSSCGGRFRFANTRDILSPISVH